MYVNGFSAQHNPSHLSWDQAWRLNGGSIVVPKKNKFTKVGAGMCALHMEYRPAASVLAHIRCSTQKGKCPIQRWVSKQPTSTPAMQTQFASELHTAGEVKKTRLGQVWEHKGAPWACLSWPVQSCWSLKMVESLGFCPTGSTKLLLLYVLREQRIKKKIIVR